MKRVLSLLLVFLMLLMIAVPVSAAVGDAIMPLYTHTDTVYARLVIDETWGIATCTGSVTAKSIVPVKVYVRLQMYKDGYWQNVNTWTATDTYSVSTTNSYAIYHGYNYRVYVTGYVYDSEGVLKESASATHTVNFP